MTILTILSLYVASVIVSGIIFISTDLIERHIYNLDLYLTDEDCKDAIFWAIIPVINVLYTIISCMYITGLISPHLFANITNAAVSSIKYVVNVLILRTK